jgi:hypothetical protein
MQAAARTSPPVADAAARAVTSAYDPATAFGFQHHDKGRRRDEPGLLTGASGIALALADYADLPAPEKPVRWGHLLNLP